MLVELLECLKEEHHLHPSCLLNMVMMLDSTHRDMEFLMIRLELVSMHLGLAVHPELRNSVHHRDDSFSGSQIALVLDSSETMTETMSDAQLLCESIQYGQYSESI